MRPIRAHGGRSSPELEPAIQCDLRRGRPQVDSPERLLRASVADAVLDSQRADDDGADGVVTNPWRSKIELMVLQAETLMPCGKRRSKRSRILRAARCSVSRYPPRSAPRFTRAVVGIPDRPFGSVAEPFQAALFIALEPFVAGLSREPEIPAQ